MPNKEEGKRCWCGALVKGYCHWAGSGTCTCPCHTKEDVWEQIDNFLIYNLKSYPVNFVGLGERAAQDMFRGKLKAILRENFISKEEVRKALKGLQPMDPEAHGWDVLDRSVQKSCCPGDDVGLGYEEALKDVAASLNIKL